MNKPLVYSVSLFQFSLTLRTAKVDTVAVFNPSMNKEVKAAVVLPTAYPGKKALPVLYLLHGFSDSLKAWLTLPRHFDL